MRDIGMNIFLNTEKLQILAIFFTYLFTFTCKIFYSMFDKIYNTVVLSAFALN